MDASGYAVGAADLCAAGIGALHSNRFQQRDMTHKVCGPDCGAVFAVAERQRLDAKQTREPRAKPKTRTEHLADAQAVFNRSICARAEALRCISCGQHHTDVRDAGHDRSDGAQPALRFHEDDTHKQCVPCNQHKGGNAIEYRIALRTRIATSGSSSWSAVTRRRSTRLRTPPFLGWRRALGQHE